MKMKNFVRFFSVLLLIGAFIVSVSPTKSYTQNESKSVEDFSDLEKLYQIVLAASDLYQTIVKKMKQASKSSLPPVDHTQDNDVFTLYVYPPKIILDWSKPATSVYTFAKLTVDKLLHANNGTVHFVDPKGETGVLEKNYISTMGHSITHVRCTLPGGGKFDEWTSFSGQNYPKLDMQLTFKNEIGAGQLFFPYADGHIIQGNENLIRLIYVSNNEGYGPRFWQTKINQKQCANLKKMVDFYKQFHYDSETTSYADLAAMPIKDKIYFTGILDPHTSYHDRMNAIAQGKDPNSVPVGGGCAPYGIALKKETGTYDADLLDNRLLLRVMVAESLIGNDIEYQPSNTLYVSNGTTAPDGRPVQKVSLKDMAKAKSWGGDDPGAAHEFTTYDPYKIWTFIGEVSQCLSENGQSLKQNFVEKPKCSEEAQAWLGRQQQKMVAVQVGETRKLSHVRKPPLIKPLKCLDRNKAKDDEDCSNETKTHVMEINGIMEI